MIPFTSNRTLFGATAFALSMTAGSMALHAQDAAPADQPAQPAQSGQPPQPYFKESVGDWRIRCVQSPVAGDPDVCQLYQLLVDESGNPVAEFTLIPSREEPADSVLATVVTPLETLLPPGIRVSVDGSPEQVVPFTWCNQIGCYARFTMQPADVEVFRSGIEAKLSITPLSAPNQQVALASSLRGFTLALESVKPK
ncbi:MAG: invasion associated locus B family protein [Dinoroseobacter sp.]|nr:invasion associated locus B family protein [Dinoroseobacter sp.]